MWSPKFRRKSWILPIQFLSGIGMLWLGSNVEGLMDADGQARRRPTGMELHRLVVLPGAHVPDPRHRRRRLGPDPASAPETFRTLPPPRPSASPLASSFRTLSFWPSTPRTLPTNGSVPSRRTTVSSVWVATSPSGAGPTLWSPLVLHSSSARRRPRMRMAFGTFTRSCGGC